MSISLDLCFKEMIDSEGSDLLLISGYPPAVRVYGTLTPINNMTNVTSEDLDEILKVAMTSQEYEDLQEKAAL